MSSPPVHRSATFWDLLYHEVIRALVACQVRIFNEVLGMDGVRPNLHSCLHFAEAIKNHGEFRVEMREF